MRRDEVRMLVRLAIGSGDIADRCNDLLEDNDTEEFSTQLGDALLDWIIEMIAEDGSPDTLSTRVRR